MNAIFYVLRSGIAWSLLPHEFPPKSTVFHGFAVFRDTCLLEKINHALVVADRERVGPRGQPVGRHPRQPERQDNRERRPAGL